MARLREWVIRVWGTLRPDRQDHDLEQELRLHQELAGENGGVAQAMEAMRDQRGLPWLDDFLRDTAPRVAAAAAQSGVHRRRRRVDRARHRREQRDVQPGRRADPPSPPRPRSGIDRHDQRRHAGRGFPGRRPCRTRTIAICATRRMPSTASSRIRSPAASFARSRDAVRAMHLDMTVSGDFFDVLGVPAVLGRTFTPDEDRVPGRDAVVVLGYDFWKQRARRRPLDRQRVVWMNGIDFHVVGVAAADVQRRRAAVPSGVLRAAHDGAAPRRGCRRVRSKTRHARVLRSGTTGIRRLQGACAGRTRHVLAAARATVSRRQSQSDDRRAHRDRERIGRIPWDTVLLAILARSPRSC